MEKIYIVASTCEANGFDLEEILHPFKSKEDAEKFLQKETIRIEDKLKSLWKEDEWEVYSCDLQRYFIKNKYGNWYDVMMIEKELR